MKIVLLDEDQRRFEAEVEWWREHRDAKELFIEGFVRTLDQLSSTPSVGKRHRFTRGKLIQRVLMKEDRVPRVLSPRSRARPHRDPFDLGFAS